MDRGTSKKGNATYGEKLTGAGPEIKEGTCLERGRTRIIGEEETNRERISHFLLHIQASTVMSPLIKRIPIGRKKGGGGKVKRLRGKELGSGEAKNSYVTRWRFSRNRARQETTPAGGEL